ncbi:MAG TPA: nickel-responsive transcriptional regulator NikR [Candidatus Thermoplasmatota archaeon]|nr:nickel-responsive transcriptional regulator NikR [Candidatus Thermoplasmatota archaeon]
MPVVSISIPDDLLADMDAAIASGGYKGRSEFLRAAVRDHLQAREQPSGRHVHGSITILYPHDKEARVSEVRHHHHDVVLSLMHTHCEAETCMDVLIVGGPPARVLALRDDLERMRDVKRCRLVVMQ